MPGMRRVAKFSAREAQAAPPKHSRAAFPPLAGGGPSVGSSLAVLGTAKGIVRRFVKGVIFSTSANL